jgi:hypothetical protein
MIHIRALWRSILLVRGDLVTLQMGKNQPRRTAERTPRQPPGPDSYWLIAEKRNDRIEVLTIRTGGEQKTLPVFSSQEEAEMILRFEGATGGWRARESGAGELVSVLSGPCAGVEKVALDPSPEMVVEGTVGLVSLHRESFIGLIMARRSGRASNARAKGILRWTPAWPSWHRGFERELGDPAAQAVPGRAS